MVDFLKKIWNLKEAVKEFIADPHVVDKQEYERRLSICQPCPRRSENTCLECGCYLPLKAYGKAWKCPLGYWDNGRTST